MSKEKQRQLEEINRPRNEELFNNIEKQYQELAKVKAESEQIDEMAKIIDANHGFIVSSLETAKALYNADYRKQSEAVKEFSERLLKELKIEGVDENGEALISVSDLRKALMIAQTYE